MLWEKKEVVYSIIEFFFPHDILVFLTLFCGKCAIVLCTDCIPRCDQRCQLHNRKRVCMRACMTCCDRCKCVPPGTFGNREKCGKCYTEMTTHGNKYKCP